MRIIFWTCLLLSPSLWGCGTSNASVMEPPLAPIHHEVNEVSAPAPSKVVAESEPMTLHEMEGPLLPENPGTDTKPAPEVPKAVVPTKLVSGNPALKKIALTFDDGPHKGFTEELIRVLKEQGVKATFFLIGRNVDQAPELAKEAFDAGIECANHTFTHSRLSLLTDSEIKFELTKGAESIAKATGFRPRFYRPPGGEYDDRVIKITQELGMTMVLWTSDAGDYTTVSGNPSEEDIKRKVLKSARNGGIVIMHDPMPPTLRALPSIITSLRAQGFEFVTVSELARDPKAVTKGGPRIVPNKAASAHALVDDPRYPWSKQNEDKNANSEQRDSGTAPQKGEKSQGTDPSGQGRGQGQQGSKIKPQDRESR